MTIQDPTNALAMSMHASKGVYALLIGSGVSRPAGIPTGWEIVLELIRRLARINGDAGEVDPETWYAEQFGEPPDYSKLLDRLVQTPTERNKLLRSYFEHQPEDDEGAKQPTAAHRAIGNLVSTGYVRVIVTTNFDHLLEQAIRDSGVEPQVISTPDAVDGALPLVHAPCTVIKVHGDYMDTRFKNTPDELGTFDSRIDALLDRVFDEFGLIVSGWSGEWDVALRHAIQRAPSRRFGTYWTARSEIAGAARELVALRGATVLPIHDADSFFNDLVEKLKMLDRPADDVQPRASAPIEELKTYLREEPPRIRLHDFVTAETEETLSTLLGLGYVDTGSLPAEAAVEHVAAYDTATDRLAGLAAVGAFWGADDSGDLWVSSVRRLMPRDFGRAWNTAARELMRYPSMKILYSAGIAATARGNYKVLARLLTQSVPTEDSGTVTAAETLLPQAVIHDAYIDALHPPPAGQRWRWPHSDYLWPRFRDAFQTLVPDDDQFGTAFDRYEYLHGLAAAHARNERNVGMWTPLGRFCLAIGRERRSVLDETDDEFQDEANLWGPFAAGLLGKHFDGAREFKREYDALLRRTASRWG